MYFQNQLNVQIKIVPAVSDHVVMFIGTGTH